MIERSERMKELLAKSPSGEAAYTSEEINRGRMVGFEEIDAIKANLDKLDRLVPGALVKLRSGEEYRVPPSLSEGYISGFLGPTGRHISRRDAMPLLRAAVEGGATVELPGEEEVNGRR